MQKCKKRIVERFVLLGASLIGVASMGTMADQQAVSGREGFRPVVVDRNAGLPDSGATANELFMARQIFDNAAPRVEHPPIDEIPWMPMPEVNRAAGIEAINKDDRAVFHDSLTGETRITDMKMPTGLIGAQSMEGDYIGVMPFEGDLLEPAGFGGMTVASGLSTSPRSYNVKLVMRFTDTGGVQRWFVCSGSMQDPGVVLTAGHCVYARTPNGLTINSFADIVYVYPAWDGVASGGAPDTDEVIQNFGYGYGTSFLAGSGWINSGDWDRDAGLIRLTRGGSRNVGMLTGWFAWAWGGSCASIQSRSYYNFSYPSENCPTAGLHTGATMYFWSGTIDDCPNNQMELTTGGNCLDTVWGGMSGSAMYYIDGDNRMAHAVCSTSNRNDVGRYCKLWEGFVLDMQDFENNTRTSSEDWEPLMMRARGSTTVRAGTLMDDSFDVKMINATNANPGVQDYQLKVYLSTNNNISVSDTLVGTWNWNARDFGAMNNVNFVVPAPSIPLDTPPGTYWIGVIADSGLPGTDTNDDTDTWDAQQITVTEGLPGQATIVSPSNGATGVDVDADIDWGVAPRADWYRVYFGTDPTPDEGELVSTTNGTINFLSTLEYSTTYYWRIDPYNTSGTTTGSVWSFTTESEPIPDLRASDASYDAGRNYYPGQFVDVTYRITNDGTGPATDVHVDFYASTNNFISISDHLLDTRDFGSLFAGGSFFVSSFVDLPSDLNPGTYYVGLISSEALGIETNTSNNWAAGASPITVLECVPDLNIDGSLNFLDVSAFLAAFGSQDPVADFTNDGNYNFLDVSAFLSAFGAGCP
tara:strand:+ start:2011 stop:4443 length:2433 start_codon:yes stop_codon:yes gene_type:complete